MDEIWNRLLTKGMILELSAISFKLTERTRGRARCEILVCRGSVIGEHRCEPVMQLTVP